MPGEKRKPKIEFDNDAVIDLIRAMFQALKEDYIEATMYLEEHQNESHESRQAKAMIALKKDCERFTKTPLYHSVTDMDGKILLDHFRKVG